MPRLQPATMAAASSSSPSIGTAHSLLVLSEYAHTLDSLPLDLSRHFADLRELDAVLSSSTISVTQKIYELIDLVENSEGSKEARLSKLTEIGEEAQRLKLGGEDKIKVASQAADNLAAHKTHMSALLAAIASYDTSFTPSHLYLRTTYPHLPPRPAPDAVPPEGARRRRAAGRGQLGGMLAVEALTPVKSRKRVRDDDDSQLAPRRERESASTNTHRRGGTSATKTRRVEPQPQSHVQAHLQPHRLVSPSADSVLSITSHPVGQPPSNGTRPITLMAQPPPQTAPRPAAAQQTAPPHPEDGEPADNDEGDGGRYCYCQGPSYGEMVGCDDEHCAFEWFHLTCIGLTNAPKAGTWYCDDCKAKRVGNKKGRSGKRRTGGGNGGVTNTNAKTGRGRT